MAAYLWRTLLLLGRGQEALTTTDYLNVLARPGAVPLCLAVLGRKTEATAALHKTLSDWHVAPPEEDGSTHILVMLLEAAQLLNDRDAVALLANRMAPAAPISTLYFALTTPARHLGAAAAFLGKLPEARTYYLQALEAAGKIRFRPEIALTHLGLAELLLDETKKPEPLDLRTSQTQQLSGAPLAAAMRKEANEHLDFAIAEFQAMKMQPSLERALRHKGLLKA